MAYIHANVAPFCAMIENLFALVFEVDCRFPYNNIDPSLLNILL